MPLGAVPENDLSCHKGSDFTPTFVVGADLASDISGWTIVGTIKDQDDDPTFTVTVNAVVTDGPNRKFKWPVPAATNAGIPVGANHLYDLWRTDSGTTYPLSKGKYAVKTERRVQTP